MLNINLLIDNKQFYNLDFINKDLSYSIICPNTNTADNLRERLVDKISLLNIDVITISEFIRGLASKLIDNFEYKNRADLLLELSTIWKIKSKNNSYDLFMKTFDLITDLRGYSTEIYSFKEFLKEFDDNIRDVIPFLWAYIKNDEHYCYSEISNRLNSSNLENNNYIFWGFYHITGVQIDFINSLSNKNNIHFFYLNSLYEQSYNFDWINWIKGNIIKYDNYNNIDNISCITAPKGKLADTLKSYIQHISSEDKNIDIFILSSNDNDILNIPFNNFYYKIREDLFKQDILKVLEEIKIKFFTNKSNKVKNEVFIRYLDNKVLSYAKLSNYKKFRILKIISSIKLIINKWIELSKENTIITFFDFNIFKNILIEVMPRINQYSMFEEAPKRYIKTFQQVDSFNPNNKTILYITSKNDFFSKENEHYTFSMIDILKSIGPIRRRELRREINIEIIKSMVLSENTTLFIEEDLLCTHPIWSNIFSNIKINKKDFKFELLYSKNIDYLDKFVSKELIDRTVSATSLETYIECPRKYYFNYINKLYFEPERKEDLYPKDIGKLQHSIIESYINNYNKLSLNIFNKVCLEIYNNAIEDKLLNIFVKDKRYIEIYNGALNGIEFLMNFYNIDSNSKFTFEKSIDNENIRGKVDCIIKNKQGYSIFDFKKSKVPTEKDIKNYIKVQLPYYIYHLGIKSDDIYSFGYINLIDIKNSIVFSKIKGECIGDVKLKQLDIDNFLKEFKSYYDQVISKMKKDIHFNAAPIKKTSCNFCYVSNICDRGDL